MRIIAFITDPSTVRDILAHHLGEPTAPQRIAPTRLTVRGHSGVGIVRWVAS